MTFALSEGTTPSAPYLSERHLAQLKDSGIAEQFIRARGYATLNEEALKAAEGRFTAAQLHPGGGLGLPVYCLGVGPAHALMYRPDKPRTNAQGKVIKYEQPRKVSPVLDVLPVFRADLLDPTCPLLITEGAKKADAVASHACTRLVPVSIAGVYNWRHKTQNGSMPLSDFDKVPLEGRQVFIGFDSDVSANANVQQAAARLGRYLASRGAAVSVIVLPHPGDTKIGLDDYLAGGHSLETALTQAQPLARFVGEEQAEFGPHPVTGEMLTLPAGCTFDGQLRVKERGEVRTIYPGSLAVTAIGRDAVTGHERLEVQFDNAYGQRVSLVAPRVDLAKRGGVVNLLADKGAHVYDANAGLISKYLFEFTHVNAERLPRHTFADRLGLLPDHTLLTPRGSIGGTAQYAGPFQFELGKEAGLYKEVLPVITEWEGASGLWLALGFSLASPVIARLNLRRNPLLYISGDSNTGKTTAALFAMGAWVHAQNTPFVVQAGRTTKAGYMQALEALSGLPFYIDEAHTAQRPEVLESVAYEFGNKQSYARGGATGVVRGGARLGGAMLLTGEALPHFQHHGAHNRMLFLSADDHPPLGTGAGRESDLGACRAALLEDAWTRGAGHLGPAFVRRIWAEADWKTFEDRVNAAQDRDDLQALNQWGPALAVVVTCLEMLLTDMLGVPVPAEVRNLPRFAASLQQVSREESDPSKVTFEQLRTLLAQAQDHNIGGVVELIYHGDFVGWVSGDRHFVVTGADAFRKRLGENAVQLHGRRWAAHGWIEQGTDGKSTQSVHCPTRRGNVRVLVIRADVLNSKQ